MKIDFAVGDFFLPQNLRLLQTKSCTSREDLKATMDEASDQEVPELLNDASHALNGPLSEEISMNYFHGEELRFHEILQTLVQEDSDGSGEDDRKLC